MREGCAMYSRFTMWKMCFLCENVFLMKRCSANPLIVILDYLILIWGRDVRYVFCIYEMLIYSVNFSSMIVINFPIILSQIVPYYWGDARYTLFLRCGNAFCRIRCKNGVELCCFIYVCFACIIKCILYTCISYLQWHMCYICFVFTTYRVL